MAGTDASATARVAALRQMLEKLHASAVAPAVAPERAFAGLTPVDSDALPAATPDWGLPVAPACGALNELVSAYPDQPAAFGFLVALAAASQQAQAGPAVLVMARRALAGHGVPYGHGLAQLGLAPERLLLIETQSDKDALWALEEVLRSGAQPAMVAGALAGRPDFTASRRLNLAAAPHRTPLVLLSGAKTAGTTAAATRWLLAAAPAARDRYGALAGPRWRIALERCRLGSCRPGSWHGPAGHQAPPGDSSRLLSVLDQPGTWLIEWNHVTLRFRVVEELADSPSAQDLAPREPGQREPSSQVRGQIRGQGRGRPGAQLRRVG